MGVVPATVIGANPTKVFGGVWRLGAWFLFFMFVFVCLLSFCFWLSVVLCALICVWCLVSGVWSQAFGVQCLVFMG